MKRKNKLVNSEVHHIFSRSIANYSVFNNQLDYERMLELFQFYQIKEPPSSFSTYQRLDLVKNIGFQAAFDSISKDQEDIVQVIAYCLMPTHIHLILKQLQDAGISLFMGNILNSYSRSFNLNHQRKGPLWESKFQNVLVKTDEQLLHLMRYLHLNPVTAFLVDRPEDWRYSSYLEFIKDPGAVQYCQYDDLIKITPERYRKFVNERVGYQRELGRIKKLILE